MTRSTRTFPTNGIERSLMHEIKKVTTGSNISAGPLPGNRLGQAGHTHVPLSPSSIILLRPMGGDALQLGR